MRGILILSIIGLLLTLSSCDENLCEESTTVKFILGFYTVEDDREIDSIVSNLTIYGISREDSLIYDQVLARKFSLPLSPAADTSRFVLRINETEDVCIVTYTRFLRLISHDCGFITEYEIQGFKHTNNNIDSVSIIQSTVTNFEEEHIKIFL